MKNIFKKINYLFGKFYPWSFFLLIFLVLIAATYQLVNLYFWGDDWDLFFKVQNPNVNMWGTGSGLCGTGPYRCFHTIFLLLYPFLHLNAGAYFAVGILIYFFAAISIYFLILELTQKKYFALGTSVIFVSGGYIGAQAIEHLQHLYAMMGMVAFTCLSVWALVKYFRNNNIFWYLLSIVLFAFLNEFYVLRAHGSILVLLSIALLYFPWRKSFKSFFIVLVKLLPFFLIYNYTYGTIINRGSGSTIKVFLDSFKDKETLGYFINFPGTFSNIIIPDNLAKVFYQFLSDHLHILKPEMFLLITFTLFGIWIVRKEKLKIAMSLSIIFINAVFLLYSKWAVSQPLLSEYSGVDSFTVILGGECLLITFAIAIALRKRRNIESRLILFGVLWFFAQYIGYFIASPAYSLFASTHRYIAPSFVATAIILTGIILAYGAKKIGIFIFSVVILFFIININTELRTITNKVSIPTKKLYENIRAQIQMLPKDPIIFMDYNKDFQSTGIGPNSYPSTGFAIFYNLHERPQITSSFEEIFKLIKDGKTDISNIISLYVDSNSVTNTTSPVHQLLLNQSETTVIENKNWSSTTPFSVSNGTFFTEPFIFSKKETLGVNPSLEAVINKISVVPMFVTLNISAVPMDFSNIKFPYRDVMDKVIGKITEENLNNFNLDENNSENPLCNKLSLILEAEKQHQEFIKTAKITTTSEWGDNKTLNLIDGKYDTDWTAFSLEWMDSHREEIIIDLGAIKPTKRLIWVNHLKRITPTQYSIFISNNGTIWEKIKQIENVKGQDGDTFITESLGDIQTRYIKMVIIKTLSSSPPSIREIWTDSLENLPQSGLTNEIKNSPFKCPISSIGDANDIINFFNNEIKAKVWWLTDARDDYKDSYEFTINTDGQNHEYKFYIPAEGTILRSIRIDSLQMPLNVSINNASIKSLSFDGYNSLQDVIK